MDYEVKSIPHGKQVIIDLPVDITAMDFSFEYYDEELKRNRATHPGDWVVDDGENAPKGFVPPHKEFKKMHDAIAYAKAVYIKFLRDELRRVKEGC